MMRSLVGSRRSEYAWTLFSSFVSLMKENVSVLNDGKLDLLGLFATLAKCRVSVGLSPPTYMKAVNRN